MKGKFILNNNSFIDVIVLKNTDKISDEKAIEMAIDLLKEELPK